MWTTMGKSICHICMSGARYVHHDLHCNFDLANCTRYHILFIPLLRFQPSSDLLGLIQVMIVTFGDFPPVYSKPKENNAPYPAQCKPKAIFYCHSNSHLSIIMLISAFMPQPGVGGGALPYPGLAGSNFPPYPGASSFGAAGSYPPYMNPSATPTTGAGGYPPYMNQQGPGYPPATGGGYNNFYNVSLAERLIVFDDTI